MADHSDEEWDEIAHAWRRVLELDASIMLDAPEFIRRLKRHGYIRDYVCVPDEDLPTSEGKFDPDDRRLYYRQSTWRAAEQKDPHAMWSLIHEATHAILKHQEVRYRASTSAQNRLSRSTNRDEFEANRLTASILAPFNKSDFKPRMSITDIRQRFGLSQQAAAKRLEEYERMYRRKNGIRRELPQGVIDFLVEQRRQGHRVTSIGNIEDRLPKPKPRYEGDACPNCGEFCMVRRGIAMKCDNCDTTTGDDQPVGWV